MSIERTIYYKADDSGSLENGIKELADMLEILASDRAGELKDALDELENTKTDLERADALIGDLREKLAGQANEHKKEMDALEDELAKVKEEVEEWKARADVLSTDGGRDG